MTNVVEAPHQHQIDELIEEGVIEIFGAKEHNLKNIDLVLPRNRLIVFTGLSGSGKSSLAFDTIFAEGQRRYMESFSAYARQFMGNLQRPDVEKINGLSPVISIEQKTASRNPRSTVGTTTEIYDFLRLLYARVGEARSSVTGKKMVKFTDDEIYQSIVKQFPLASVDILAPLVKGRKGHYRELFEQLFKMGFTKVRVDGEVLQIVPDMKIGRYKIHDIELIVDRISISGKSSKRLRSSITLALKQGKGSLMVLEPESGKTTHYSRNLMDPDSGIAYDEPQPNSFSFNSPYGYCEKCKGLGTTYLFDPHKIFPDKSLSIAEGGIAPLGRKVEYWYKQILQALAKKFSFKLTDSIQDIPQEGMDAILYGVEEKLLVESEFGSYRVEYEGLLKNLENLAVKKRGKKSAKDGLNDVAYLTDCPECNGYRLKKQALNFFIHNKHIGEAANMQLDVFMNWINGLEEKFTGKEKIIATEVLKEIHVRTQFLLNVGLEYLSLNRSAATLSGGEAQRIRLATQIGSQLINVLYILDEPSIGLHQRDNHRLIKSLKNLRDLGNTVLVVEHDKDMIQNADYIVDLGPGAGIHGGEVVAHGTPYNFVRQDSLTAQYIAGTKEIATPVKRRKGNGKILQLLGATGHNLKNVDLHVPLGMMICVTGVSGSGKSSLINETLYPILRKHFYRAGGGILPYKKIKGLEHLDKVIEIDQSPIGRTPRSNPATYTGIFTLIRSLFTELPEAKIRGYKPGRFSFNVKGGRCEDCRGGGMKVIEMNFLPDVYVECPTCFGKRYNRQTLEVRYKGKSIGDVLAMSIEEAMTFFEPVPQLHRKIKTLHDVGLDYISLGQSSTTLSGGEAQRVKLATELSKKDTGQTLYILDEPTTGLHFEDIRILMEVLNELADRGNTVLIIEHNMDVIKLADHIIDLGPEGGNGGGQIIAAGTPEEVISASSSISYTANYLKAELIL